MASDFDKPFDELPEPPKYIQLEAYIAVNDLCERLFCNLDYINKLMSESVLVCYEVRGWTGFYGSIAQCVKRAGNRPISEKEGRVTGVGAFIFDMADVDIYEQGFYEKKEDNLFGDWSTENAPFDWDTKPSPTDDAEPEFIPAEQIRLELGMSPWGFVDFLNEDHPARLMTSQEGEYRMALSQYESNREYYNNLSAHPPFAFFTPDGLTALTVHHIDWEKWKAEWRASQNNDNASEEQGSRIAELEKENAELKAQLAAVSAAAESSSTVDAAKWEGSLEAAFQIWVDWLQGDKTDWKELEFTTALSQKYSDYHTKVSALAWKYLPRSLKHGAGRPKKNKNPKNPEQPDNT